MNACIYCSAKLGQNRLLPELPVGKRLAYDPADARVWVVCPKCERWNLSWLDEPERAEAVKRLDQYFAAAPDKTDAGGISVAEVGKTSLIRIGAAPWPTFAIRRYARRLVVRRRWAYVFMAANLGGLVFMYTPAYDAFLANYGLSTAVLFVLIAGIWAYLLRTRMRVTGPSGQRLKLNIHHAFNAAVSADDSGWRLHLEGDNGDLTLQGEEAIRAMALHLSAMSDGAATGKRIRDAIALIERAGDPKRFLADVLSVQTLGTTPQLLAKMPIVLRLALEIAVNEEAERAAFRGQLAAVALERDTAHAVAEMAYKHS